MEIPERNRKDRRGRFQKTNKRKISWADERHKTSAPSKTESFHSTYGWEPCCESDTECSSEWISSSLGALPFVRWANRAAGQGCVGWWGKLINKINQLGKWRKLHPTYISRYNFQMPRIKELLNRMKQTTYKAMRIRLVRYQTFL